MSKQVQEVKDKRSKSLKASPNQILKAREMRGSHHAEYIYHSAEADDQ